MSEHLSYEGQPEVDYCVECAQKHSQTAKVLMREALQRAESDGPQSEGVKEKVRGIIEELSGMEDDTDTVQNEKVTALNTTTRNLRKYIYSTKAEIGGADMDTLRELKMMVDMLVDQVYKTREEVEECPECKVPSAPKPRKIVEEEVAPDLEQYGVAVAQKRRKFIEELQAEKIG